ncbi:MAG TPA: membrane protein insertase YidC [Candidatus Saccharimonadales bacterium]|nr:membrane protein insertase YidC [Candidatus Saccharimonadales bacterium]
MDRKVLIAMVMIMMVLLLDQVISPRYYRPKTKAAPGQAAPGKGSAPANPTASATAPVPVTPGSADSAAVTTGGGLTSGGLLSSGAALTKPLVEPAPTQTREIRTDRYVATLTSDGATIAHWMLPGYKDEIRNQPLDLVAPGARAFPVVVETGSRALDFSEAPFRVVQDGAAQGPVAFEAVDQSGVRVTKTFHVGSDPRLLEVEVRVSAPPELGPIRYRIGWGAPLPMTEPSTRHEQPQAVALLGTKLENIAPGKIAQNAEKILPPGNVRWVASRNKYFIAAVIPDSGTVSDVAFRGTKDGLVTSWLLGSATPGATVVRHTRVYGGPIHYETLESIGAGLDEVANLGWRWMRGISVLLLKCLNLLHKAIPNYGVAIILLAAATKLLFYPLTQSSLRSMKVMHHLQPQIKELQDKFKGDPMKLNTAMMALYKENNVNPMSGCLPMLLQVPVFIGLYNVLLYSIELRASGFVGYIHDLAAPDVLMTVLGFPIHLMPVIMTGSTYLLQSQTPVAPAQKGMMYVMPLFMLFFMYSFPSGVVLYWTVNNLLSALQQYLVNLAEDRKMAAQA